MIEASIRLSGASDQIANVQDLVALTSRLAETFEEVLRSSGITGVSVERVALHHNNRAAVEASHA